MAYTLVTTVPKTLSKDTGLPYFFLKVKRRGGFYQLGSAATIAELDYMLKLHREGRVTYSEEAQTLRDRLEAGGVNSFQVGV